MTPPSTPSGVAEIDALSALSSPTVQDYVVASSAYVRSSRSLNASQLKACQIRLSAGLGHALRTELQSKEPAMSGLVTGERDVAGGLRIAKADVSEIHHLDGLRFAVEIKPVNLAVGRALWNLFGDIRTFAVNIHLKFPFAVVGGLLTIPTYEESISSAGSVSRKPTTHLIGRAVTRLARAGGRRTEGDAPHLLEGVGVLVYNPDNATIDQTLPAAGTRLRWDEFIEDLVAGYRGRFVE